MSKIFAITSGKGGVGKSTVSVGLATAFSEEGLKVLLVDMDQGFRCLDLLLSVDSKSIFDLADVLNGHEIEDALYPCDKAGKLWLIPAPARANSIESEAFKGFVENIADKFDIIIFDFPAGINLPLYSALPKGALFLTVAVPDPVSIRDAAQISRELGELEFSARLIINRFILQQSRKYGFKNIDSIIDYSNLRLLGIIPESQELHALSVTHSINKRCRAKKAFKRISLRLLGSQLLLPKLKKI